MGKYHEYSKQICNDSKGYVGEYICPGYPHPKKVDVKAEISNMVVAVSKMADERIDAGLQDISQELTFKYRQFTLMVESELKTYTNAHEARRNQFAVQMREQQAEFTRFLDALKAQCVTEGIPNGLPLTFG